MSAEPSAAPEFRSIPLAELRESKLNPRRHFDAGALAELTESIRAHGVLTPTLVRPVNGHYEIAAGHRRYRAAKAAGLAELPAVVRPMDDVAFLEVLVTENLQREDVHPLEEAEGYRALMKAGYDVQRIADRVGRSVKYVYDRMKLLELTKDAKDLFFDGRITAGHAVILARLRAADQARVIGSRARNAYDTRGGGLFVDDHGLFEDDNDDNEDLDKRKGHDMDRLKPVSVRELQGWIDRNVRFDRAAVDPMLFPETASTLAEAKEVAEKIIPITHDYHVQPEAKADGERTYGPMSWRPATGVSEQEPGGGSWSKSQKSKTCEKSVLGVFVVGQQRGETKRVCVNKACEIHWPKEKPKKTATRTSGAYDYKAEQERNRKEQERQDLERKRWAKAAPAIAAAVAEKIAAAKGLGAIAQIVLDQCAPNGYGLPKAKMGELAPKGASADAVLRRAAFLVVAGVVFDSWRAPRNVPKLCRAFGVDVAKILEAEAPAEKSALKPQTSAKPARKKK